MKYDKPDATRPLTVIGWHECISLPDLSLKDFAVKIDTGAKTTALHADDIETFYKDSKNGFGFAAPILLARRRASVNFRFLRSGTSQTPVACPRRGS